jgi:hypothetical protein
VDALAGEPAAIRDMTHLMHRIHNELAESHVYVAATNISAGLAEAQATIPSSTPFGISMLPARPASCSWRATTCACRTRIDPTATW